MQGRRITHQLVFFPQISQEVAKRGARTGESLRLDVGVELHPVSAALLPALQNVGLVGIQDAGPFGRSSAQIGWRLRARRRSPHAQISEEDSEQRQRSRKAKRLNLGIELSAYEGYPLVALCNLKGIERLTLHNAR